jgi:hypothetical protein
VSYYRPIDGTKTVYLNTHLPSTAAEGDADSLPTYRVYEEITDTTILTGTMAKLDDANTVGLYAARIALTAANGFEAGKEYGVRMRAIVETIPMSKTETFGIWPSVIPSTVAGTAVVLGQGPYKLRRSATNSQNITVYAGDQFPLAFELVDGTDAPVPLDGLTLTVRVVADDDTVLYTDEVATVAWDDGGGVTWTPSVAWATPGGSPYRLTIKTDDGAGRKAIFGGFTVTVQDR